MLTCIPTVLTARSFAVWARGMEVHWLEIAKPGSTDNAHWGTGKHQFLGATVLRAADSQSVGPKGSGPLDSLAHLCGRDRPCEASDLDLHVVAFRGIQRLGAVGAPIHERRVIAELGCQQPEQCTVASLNRT